MNTKQFLAGGLAGGITDFLLGWILYDVVFKSFFPSGDNMKIEFIALGCLTYSFFISYLLQKRSELGTKNTIVFGAAIGLFTGLFMNFFNFSTMPFDATLLCIDVFISILMSAVVAFVSQSVMNKL